MTKIKFTIGLLFILDLIFTPVMVSAATNYGKGVIYYTENYLRNYSGTNSIYNWPIPKPAIAVPETDVNAAYFDPNGTGYTVIKGNTYWYRKQTNAPWTSSSLQNLFYSSGNAADVGIPIQDIDSAYYDTAGGYTVIDGDQYW